MRDLDLVDISIELLRINQQFYQDMNYDLYKAGKRIRDYEFYTFEQSWANTSGGFEGIGGQAITEQRTYVFIPWDIIQANDYCLVYFGARFAYAVPYSDKFMEDVKNQKVAGKMSYRKYFEVKQNV